MKKTYLTPALIVKSVKINNILAGSPGLVNGTATSGDAKESLGFEDDIESEEDF